MATGFGIVADLRRGRQAKQTLVVICRNEVTGGSLAENVIKYRTNLKLEK